MIKSPLLICPQGSEPRCLGVGSCGKLGRNGFHEVVKIESGFSSAGGFTGIWVHVLSS